MKNLSSRKTKLCIAGIIVMIFFAIFLLLRNSLLILAAENGCWLEAKTLLKLGANVNTPNKFGYTPLWFACAYGDSLFAAELVDEYRADVNPVLANSDENVRRQSPLHLVAAAGDWRLCKIFLDRGANVKAKDSNGCSPLWRASPNVMILKLLVENGGDIHETIPNGDTLLHGAACGYADIDNSDAVQYLLTQGLDVNALDKRGRTPLYKAIDSGKIPSAKILIDHGADIEVRAKNGISPLQLARKKKLQAIIDILRQKGATE